MDGLFDNYKDVILNNLDLDVFDVDKPEEEIRSICKKLSKDRDLLCQIGISNGKKLRKIKKESEMLFSDEDVEQVTQELSSSQIKEEQSEEDSPKQLKIQKGRRMKS